MTCRSPRTYGSRILNFATSASSVSVGPAFVSSHPTLRRTRSCATPVPISLEPRSEQAHVPAEQPPPREDPRFPAAHAHSRRSRHPRRSSPQGPPGSVGLSRPESATIRREPAKSKSLKESGPLVLPTASRLRQRCDFTATVRRGRRVGRERLVVHLELRPVPTGSASSGDQAVGLASAVPRAGFVVGKTVGGAVVRNRVRRQLRHIVADRLDQLPPGSTLVVRALPSAAGASSADLRGDFEAALARAVRPSRLPKVAATT